MSILSYACQSGVCYFANGSISGGICDKYLGLKILTACNSEGEETMKALQKRLEVQAAPENARAAGSARGWAVQRRGSGKRVVVQTKPSPDRLAD